MIQFEKTDYNTKIDETEENTPNHDKYSTSQKFNTRTTDNFAEFATFVTKAKFATKNDIAYFVKKVQFDEKLTNINKNVTSNEARHVEVKKKLDDLSEKLN